MSADATPRASSPANLAPSPANPPRPASPNSQNHATLVEAFPNIDPVVVRAVLVASRGDLEPAFNALLSMSDPSAVETPPPPPPRPRAADFTTSTPQSQLDADAQYARQLQQQLGAGTAPQQRRPLPQHQPPPQRRHRNDSSDDEYYNDRNEEKDRPSFFDEDLPVIKENIKKGFIETQTKVTGWFNDFKKRIDGESPETSPPASARNSSSSYSRAGTRGQQRGGYDTVGRPSYDADPKVLSDDFTHLNVSSGSGEFHVPLLGLLG